MSYYPSQLSQIKAGVDPATFATSGCLNRRLVSYRDRFGFMQHVPVNCGRCFRCQDDKRNQWAARMWLHTVDTDWNYVYFVTLTYAPFDHTKFTSHPYLDSWLDTYPVFDSYNESGKHCWSPSILVLSHIQKYIKRLRASLSGVTPISYAYCGEYGESWARPHWHLILFAKSPLSADVISSAWGFSCFNVSDGVVVRASGQPGSYFHSFGKVDVVDLVANGTLYNTTAGNSEFNAMYNFSYVAKYLGKSCKFIEDFIDYDNFVSQSGSYEVNQASILLGRFERIWSSLPVSKIEYDAESSPFRHPYRYASSSLVHKHDFKYNGVNYEKLSFEEFTRLLSPVFHASTRYCLGKEYGVANLKRFEKGNKSLPQWRGKNITFPSYFSYLLELERAPLRFEKATFASRSFTHSDYSLVRQYFEMLSVNPQFVSSLSSESQLCDLLRTDVNEINQKTCYSLVDWRKLGVRHNTRTPGYSNFSDCVLKSSTRTLRAVFNWNDDVFELYEFDPGSRRIITDDLFDSDGTPLNPSRYFCNYRIVDFIPRVDFCNYVIEIIDRSKKYDIDTASARAANLELFDVLESSVDVLDHRSRWVSARSKICKIHSIYHYDPN